VAVARAVGVEDFTLEEVKALAVPAIRARIATVFIVLYCIVLYYDVVMGCSGWDQN